MTDQDGTNKPDENGKNGARGGSGAENKMGTVPVGRLLITMSAPAMLSTFIQAMYNIVDSVFVSRISEDALAAVTLVFPVQMLMISVAIGTGVGLNSLIARRLGEKRFAEADDAATQGFFLAAMSWVVFAVLGLALLRPFLSLFTDDRTLLSLAFTFGRLIMVGSLFMFFQITTEKVLQATGNMLFPMIFNITGAVCNIVLNPILIFGLFGAPALGIAGSATATLISQFIAMCIAFALLLGRKHAVHIKLAGFRPRGGTIRDIYAVGLPSVVMQAAMSVAMSGINAILIHLTPTAVAVFGVYFRIQSLVFMPVFGLNQGALPIIAYNYGARNRGRLMRAYKTALLVAALVMAAGTVVFQLFPIPILQMFQASPDMMHIGSRALRIISVSFVPAAFTIVTITLFQALAHGLISMTVSLLRQFIMVLPLIWFLAQYYGVDYVWAAYPISEILCVVVIFVCVLRVYGKEIKHLTPEG